MAIKRKPKVPFIRDVMAAHGTRTGKKIKTAVPGDTLIVSGNRFGKNPARVIVLFDDSKVAPHRAGFSDNQFFVTVPLIERSTSTFRVQIGKMVSRRKSLNVRRMRKPRGPAGIETSKFTAALDEYASHTAAFTNVVARSLPFGSELQGIAEMIHGMRKGLQKNLEQLLSWRELQREMSFEPLKTLANMDQIVTAGGFTDRVHAMTAAVYGRSGLVATKVDGSSGVAAIHDGRLAKFFEDASISENSSQTDGDSILNSDVRFFLGTASQLIHEHTKELKAIEHYYKTANPSVSVEAGVGVDVSINFGEAISGIAQAIDAIAQWFGVGATGGDQTTLIDILARLELLHQEQLEEFEKIKEDIQEAIDKGNEIKRETATIEQKAVRLGNYLGETLVGEPWPVHPMSTTQPKIPDKSIKDEMHDVEALLANMYYILTGSPFDPNGPVPGGPTPIPWGPHGPFIADNPDPIVIPPDAPRPPMPRLDQRLKKIYVYEEGVFEPQSANDEKIIHIKTDAFDLSGWLDLSQLRSGDRVLSELYVAVAGQAYQLFDHREFRQPGLWTLGDFARGETRLSGSDFRIVIKQPSSQDGFVTPIRIAYQFVVESQ